MLLTISPISVNLFSSLPHAAVEFGSSFSQGDKTPLYAVVFLYLSESIKTVLIRFNSFMVGVLRSRKACRILDPIYQLNTLTAQSLVASGGGLKPTVKELVMSQHNYTQEPTTETALIELSIKIGSLANCNSLFTQGFSQYIDSLDKPLSEITSIELAELINQYREAFNYPKISTPKTSRFTVLRKSNHSRIAENITYKQALQYQDNESLVIKFSGMMGCAI